MVCPVRVVFCVVCAMRCLVRFPSECLIRGLCVSGGCIVFIMLGILLLTGVAGGLCVLSVTHRRTLEDVFQSFQVVFNRGTEGD